MRGPLGHNAQSLLIKCHGLKIEKLLPASVNISAMTWSRLKKPCKCSHSKSMHSTKTVKGKPFTACNHPGCDCKKFRLTKS